MIAAAVRVSSGRRKDPTVRKALTVATDWRTAAFPAVGKGKVV
jgi:hypothetical protein